MRLLETAVIVATLATTVAPGNAMEEEGDGYNNGSVGIVVAMDQYAEETDSSDDNVLPRTITGDCDFEGVILPAVQPGGGQIVRFSGNVVAAGPRAESDGTPSVPILTNIRCEILNDFGYYHSQDLQLNGNAVTVVGSTLNDETQIWPLQPITVCVSGKAVFGPSPAIEFSLRRRCRTPQ